MVYSPKRLPRGVAEADLAVGIVPGRRGGSVLRADGEVAWFPQRPAAERLRPAAYRAVTITRTSQNGRRTAQTSRSRAAIGRLARVLNSLPASDGGSSSCPSGTGAIAWCSGPRRTSPRFVVTALGCATDSVTVAGRDQPARDTRERARDRRRPAAAQTPH